MWYSGMRGLYRKQTLFVLAATPRPPGTSRTDTYSV